MTMTQARRAELEPMMAREMADAWPDDAYRIRREAWLAGEMRRAELSRLAIEHYEIASNRALYATGGKMRATYLLMRDEIDQVNAAARADRARRRAAMGLPPIGSAR